MATTQPLILASASPRRQELLSLYGIPFEVLPSTANEDASGSGHDRVLELAKRKCADVSKRYPGRYVLAADTLVCVDGQVLGKPTDEADAERMLALLSGREHQVYTGICLHLPDGSELSGVEATNVHFLPISDDAIHRYVQTGEPMDKAGAYAIQGKAGVFVSHIEGSPSNVVGLPLGLLTQLMERAGIALFGA